MNEQPTSQDQVDPDTKRAYATARDRCIRLWILRILDACPGRCGNDELMHAGLSHVGLPTAREALLAHLRYLAEKRLIQLEYVDDFSFKVWTIKLTCTGQDLISDLIEVEGIERISATDPS